MILPLEVKETKSEYSQESKSCGGVVLLDRGGRLRICADGWRWQSESPVGLDLSEFSTAGGFAGSTAMYVAALVCFIGGVWYLWQSRQPENRESGKVAAGLAGLVLTGLFVAGGAWINKAAQTTSGGAATISSQAAVVTFQ